MPTPTNVNGLKINKLTKAQYDDIQNPSETELYLVEESIDTTPTQNSTNPVQSGGVYTALGSKADSSSLAAVATSGNYNDLNNKPPLNCYCPETTTIPNVTSVGSASTWSFAMGTGNDEHTLIISGGNGTAPSLGTAKTVATGKLGRTSDGVEPHMEYIYTPWQYIPSGGSND